MPISAFRHSFPRHSRRSPGLGNIIVDGLKKAGEAILESGHDSFNGNGHKFGNGGNSKDNKDDDGKNEGNNSHSGGNGHQGGNGQEGQNGQQGDNVQHGDNGQHGGDGGVKNDGDSGGEINNNPPQEGSPQPTTNDGSTDIPGGPGGLISSQVSKTSSSEISSTIRRDTSTVDVSDSPNRPTTSPIPVLTTASGGLDVHSTGFSFSPGTRTQISVSASASITPEAATSHRPNRGAIAGGVLGVLFFLFLLAVALVFYRRRRKSRVAPSAEFLAHSAAAYPFARAGFGNSAGGAPKGAGTLGKGYSGTGKGAAGQVQFRGLSTDSGQGMLSEKEHAGMGQFKDEKLPDLRAQHPQLAPPPPPPVEIGEVLYSTPIPGATQGSAPGTPTTPSGRRIPFGTGTFQFPPRDSMQ